MKTKFLNLSSVAIVVVAILSLGLFFSCEEKKENTECSFKNPVADLPWLKIKVTELS